MSSLGAPVPPHLRPYLTLPRRRLQDHEQRCPFAWLELGLCALSEDRVIEVPADAARYAHQTGLFSGRQALQAAFGFRTREGQHKGGPVASYRAQNGRLGRAASEVIEDRSDS